MPTLLNKSDMASSLGISVQAFDKWGVKPVERRGREVMYDMRSVLDNRLNHQSQKHQPDDPDEESFSKKKEFESWRLVRAQADGVELANEKKRGEVVDSGFCIFVLARLAGEIAGILDGVPLSMQRRFPDLESRHIEFLKIDVTKARNKAADLAGIIPDLLNEYIAESDK